MATLWIAAVLWAAAPDGPAAGPVQPAAEAAIPESQQPIVPYRTGTELRDAVRDTLRRWARVDDKHAQQASREFLVLYKELEQDTLMPRAQSEEYRTKVRGRLADLSVQISKRVAIERRLAERQPNHQPKSLRGVPADASMAQMGFGGAMMGGNGMMGGQMGGGQMGGGGAFNANDDYGPALVELIQTTIAPKTWEVNGGPGTIYYWRSQRALVVRQMGEVHEQIGGLMDQMDRLGR
jgi:hypothetical protein